jgi:hypothetical protein
MKFTDCLFQIFLHCYAQTFTSCMPHVFHTVSINLASMLWPLKFILRTLIHQEITVHAAVIRDYLEYFHQTFCFSRYCFPEVLLASRIIFSNFHIIYLLEVEFVYIILLCLSFTYWQSLPTFWNQQIVVKTQTSNIFQTVCPRFCRGSVVSISSRLRDREAEIRIPARGSRDSSPSKDPDRLIFSGEWVSPPSMAEVKNKWCCVSTPPYFHDVYSGSPLPLRLL